MKLVRLLMVWLEIVMDAIADPIMWLNVGCVFMNVIGAVFFQRYDLLISLPLNIAAVYSLAGNRLSNLWDGKIFMPMPMVTNIGIGWFVWFVRYTEVDFGSLRWVYLPCLNFDFEDRITIEVGWICWLLEISLTGGLRARLHDLREEKPNEVE